MRWRSTSFLICATIVAVGAAASAQDTNYQLRLSDTAAVGGFPAQVELSLDILGMPLQGFSLGVCSDSVLVAPVSLEFGAAMLALNGGQGPDFFEAQLYPTGLTCGTVFSFMGTSTIPPGVDLELAFCNYETSPGVAVASLIFCSSLGSPPVPVVVARAGMTVIPVVDDGSITLVESADFIRGDVNASGAIDIADPIYTLSYLFSQGPGICIAAMDSNTDAAVDLADALYLLSYINGLGPQPSAPFPACGTSPGSALPCVQFAVCR